MGKTSSRSESSSRADQKSEKNHSSQFHAMVIDTGSVHGAKKDIAKTKKEPRSERKKSKEFDLNTEKDIAKPKKGSRSQRKKSKASDLNVKMDIAKPKKRRSSRRKKSKAFDLSTLSEFLPDLKAPNQQPISTITQEEIRRIEVLNNITFEADSFASVRNPVASVYKYIINRQTGSVTGLNKLVSELNISSI